MNKNVLWTPLPSGIIKIPWTPLEKLHVSTLSHGAVLKMNFNTVEYDQISCTTSKHKCFLIDT